MRRIWAWGIALFCFLGAPGFAGSSHLHHDAERDFHSPAAKLATGDLSRWRGRNFTPYAWPVKVLSIGHTMASYQNYGRLPSGAYFHHGLDIRADAGSTVTAAVGGKVVNVENYVAGSPAYWEIAILDDDGFLWQYHHVDRDSIPQAVLDAFKSGGKIATGAKIGEVYYWPVVTFGERFHHVHLNVLGKDQSYVNPFSFLAPLGDSAAPQIKQISIVQNGKRVEGNRVSGKYTLAAEVGDLILHDKFTVPPNTISYEVDGSMPVMTWQFDSLPGGSSNTKFVSEFYIGNTCGNYSCRRAVIDLGFRLSPQQIFPVTPGPHRIVVRVRDFEGNQAEKSFDWTVN